MIKQSDIDDMRWRGVANLEPAQVNELLRLAELGLAQLATYTDPDSVRPEVK